MSSTTLSGIIASHRVTTNVIALLQHPLVEQLIKLRDGSSPCGVNLSAATIAVDDRNSSVALTPEALASGGSFDEPTVLHDYGVIMLQVLGKSRQRTLADIARQCADGEIGTLNDLYTLLERRASNFVYIPLIALVSALLALLWWLNAQA